MRRIGAAFVAVVTLSAPMVAQSQDQDVETAIFAGGCFWCMEPPYDKLDGVLATTSGFSGVTLKILRMKRLPGEHEAY